MVPFCGHSEKGANSVQRKRDSALRKLAQEKEGPGGEAVGGSYRWWGKTSQRQEGENGYFLDHKACHAHVGECWHLKEAIVGLEQASSLGEAVFSHYHLAV